MIAFIKAQQPVFSTPFTIYQGILSFINFLIEMVYQFSFISSIYIIFKGLLFKILKWPKTNQKQIILVKEIPPNEHFCISVVHWFPIHIIGSTLFQNVFHTINHCFLIYAAYKPLKQNMLSSFLFVHDIIRLTEIWYIVQPFPIWH